MENGCHHCRIAKEFWLIRSLNFTWLEVWVLTLFFEWTEELNYSMFLFNRDIVNICNFNHGYCNFEQRDMLRNQQNTCLVRRAINPPQSYHFIGGSLQSIHQVRLVPVPLARECIMPYGVAENVHTTAAFQIVNIILKVIFYLLLQKTHYRYQSSLS